MSLFTKRAVSNYEAARLAAQNMEVGAVEQARVAAGHVLGRTAGGALIGAGLNGAQYSQTGAGIGGSFSMGEALASGALAGAVVGGGVGLLGARGAAKSVTANAAKAQRRLLSAESKLVNPEDKTRYQNIRALAKKLKRKAAKTGDHNLAVEAQQMSQSRRSLGLTISDNIDALKSFGLSDDGATTMKRSVFTKAQNPQRTA